MTRMCLASTLRSRIPMLAVADKLDLFLDGFLRLGFLTSYAFSKAPPARRFSDKRRSWENTPASFGPVWELP